MSGFDIEQEINDALTLEDEYPGVNFLYLSKTADIDTFGIVQKEAEAAIREATGIFSSFTSSTMKTTTIPETSTAGSKRQHGNNMTPPAKRLHASQRPVDPLAAHLLLQRPNTEYIGVSFAHQTRYSRIGAELYTLPPLTLKNTNESNFDELSRRAHLLKIRQETEDFKSKESLLWIDKYAPNSFIHLLTDDRSNREVISWLKSWESFINKPKTVPAPENMGLILSGPAGIGKTSLAVICAKQAGYNPIVISAPIVANKEDFRNKIVYLVIFYIALKKIDAISFKKLFAEEGKSNKQLNCVIIDEIDGLQKNDAKGVVEFIEQLLKSQKEKVEQNYDSTMANETVHQTKAHKKPKTKRPQRPIIFTCCDPFISFLRNIRRQSKVFYLKKPSSIKMVERLKAIAMTENIFVDSSTLFTLCEQTNGDIRSCLNSLQLMKDRTASLSNKKMSKDINISIYDIWNSIFDQEEDPLFKRVDISHDLPTIINGAFQNYLCLKQPTIASNRNAPMISCSEWFSCADVGGIDSILPSALSHSFALTKQTQRLFATNFPFPRLPYLLKKRKQRLEEILKSVSDRYCTKAGSLSRCDLSLDLCPFIGAILNPLFRTVHVSVLSSQEKALIRRTAQIHVIYNIRYNKQKETPEGNSAALFLDPALDFYNTFGFDQEIVMFLANPIFNQISPGTGYDSGLSQTTHLLTNRRNKIGPTQKQTIANEIAVIIAENRAKQQRIQQEEARKQQQQQQKAKTSNEPLVIQTKDFFGRIVKTEKKVQTETQTATHKVQFKFQEGFSNAVRRKVFVRDFL